MTRGLLVLLLASAVAFALLSFVPGARQKEIFPYDELCDYRMFILPCMTSERPYSAPAVELRDACYPPIAYCAVGALSLDRGVAWNITTGEARLLLSLLLAHCLAALLLVWKISGRGVRLATAAAIIMSPAFICTLLRGNPSGWSFALVCVFLFWYRSEDPLRRTLAAVALGAATALKLTPCLFGVLYLSEAVSRSSRIPWRDVFVSASVAIVLVFLPFLFFGGVHDIPSWISNAGANAAFYSVDNPLWGFAAFANHVIDSKEIVLPSIGLYALGTRILAAALVFLALFARNEYLRLLCIGAAMAFLTHHDYGGAYLIPAFVAWLRDVDGIRKGVCPLLEALAWFVILTPLQIPNPFYVGTLNSMLQNELLFVLLASAAFTINVRRRCV